MRRSRSASWRRARSYAPRRSASCGLDFASASNDSVWIAGTLARKRDLLVAGLRTAGFTVFPTRGTYFVMTDVTPLGFDDGAAFCWRLPELIGVAAVPVSVFCPDPDAAATCHAARQPLLHGRGLGQPTST